MKKLFLLFSLILLVHVLNAQQGKVYDNLTMEERDP